MATVRLVLMPQGELGQVTVVQEQGCDVQVTPGWLILIEANGAVNYYPSDRVVMARVQS